MTLERLLDGADIVRMTSPAVEVESIVIDIRQAGPGTLFVKAPTPAGRPPSMDMAAALGRGTAAILMSADDEAAGPGIDLGANVVLVNDVYAAYAVAAGNFHGNPHRELTLLAITGTKGKTTSAHIAYHLLNAAGHVTGLISTIGIRYPDGEAPTDLTTPQPMMLHHHLRRMADQGATHAVVEVSSIGLAEQRVYGLRFAAVALTNIGTEHFEYHGGRAGYVAAKARLLADASLHASDDTLCAVNADDAEVMNIAGHAHGHVLTFGLREGMLRPTHYDASQGEIEAELDGRLLRVPLIGEYNLYNVLTALALTSRCGVSLDVAAAALPSLPPLPGRMQRVTSRSGVDVFVDYAHTPESVAAALDALRATNPGRRLVAVVGCSGNSDRGKRPLIARAAFESADLCIFTSDNPDAEHPLSIARQMLLGVSADGAGRVTVVIDRREAIARAVQAAVPDGVVALLGKGSETIQVVNGRRLPHSDAHIAVEVLQRLDETVSRQ